MYQSTDSVICTDPVAASIRSAMFDLVERLIETKENLIVLFFEMRSAVRWAVVLLVPSIGLRRMPKAEDARDAAHDRQGRYSVEKGAKHSDSQVVEVKGISK